MKKILLLSIVIITSVLFFSCDLSSDDGPTSDESYAGSWYSGAQKLVLTDSTFERSEKMTGETAYTPSAKGTVVKKSATTMDVTMTHMYLVEDAEHSITAADEGWYSKAELIAFGIEKGFWTDEAGMIAMVFEGDGDQFVTFTGTYEVSADGTTLTMTLDGDTEIWSSTAP